MGVFLKDGNPGEIETFLKTQVANRNDSGSFLSQCGEPTIIKLILEKASTNDILYSSVLSKLLGAIPETTPLETLSLLKGKVAEAMKKRTLDESFGKSLAARLDLLLDKYNPFTIVKGYLRGEGDVDEARKLLSQPGSALRNAWNSNIIITVQNQDPKEFLELLRRGEPEFINS